MKTTKTAAWVRLKPETHRAVLILVGMRQTKEGRNVSADDVIMPLVTKEIGRMEKAS